MAKTINITGWYGSGNAGDEAMAVGFTKHLRSLGHTPIVHTKNGDNKSGYQSTHWMNRGVIESSDLLIIGGGDLGPGSGWNLIPFALHSGVPIAMLGVTVSKLWHGRGTRRAIDLNRAVLNSMRLIAPRDSASLSRVKELLGPNCEAKYKTLVERKPELILGGDPAFLLPRPERERVKGRATVFVRHVGAEEKDEQAALAIEAVQVLKTLGYANILLAGCAADDVRVVDGISKAIGLPHAARDASANPGMLGEICASSEIVVSIRRLHPVIFSVITNTPAVAVDFRCAHPPGKIESFCRDAGVECVKPGRLMEAIIKTHEKKPDYNSARDEMTGRAEAMVAAALSLEKE